MKILVAIPSSENPDLLANTTLRWAARAGFNLRIFIPDEEQRESYVKSIDDANYDYFLDIPEEAIVSIITPLDYAQEHNFDLLVTLPDSLYDWDKENTLGTDKTVIDYAEAIGAARVLFGQQPELKEHEFGNGAIMTRVKKV